jgi:phosphatidylserine/phosphatidylglycerophosphate/cardiolipin synthase-like enzyme
LQLGCLALGLVACRGGSTDTPGDGVEPIADPSGSIRLILNDPLQFPAPEDRCEAEHCLALVELIDGAQETIDFALYGMRDQSRVMEALRAAKARGVKIRGVVDRDLEGNNYYSSTEALIELIGKGKVRDDQAADAMISRRDARRKFEREPRCERPEGFKGPVQCLAYDLGDECLLAAHSSREELEGSEGIMHNKFFIADGRKLWTGSTNVSDSGTGGYNANLVTVVDSELVGRWYTEEFEQMFEKRRYHTLKEAGGPFKATLRNAEVEVMFSPQNDPIRRGVRPLLKHAEKRIDIAVFFLTHKHITEDLIAAHQRGVKVRVIIDATGAKNGYTKHELLRAAGIPVKVENWGGKMHMKSAVIDDDKLVTGSMNWTSAGEYSNDENTILVQSPQLAAQYSKFFDKIWNEIPDTWLEANPDPESRDSTTACTDGSDNDFDRLRDAEDPGCSDTPPPLPELPPWRKVPKNDRLTCDPGMD